jgi:hypothetical protein
MLYDIYLGRYTRKISKASFYAEENSREVSGDMSGKDKGNEAEAAFDSNAYDIDPKCKILVYAFGRIIKFCSIYCPDSIKKHMAPQYKVSEHKYSPARV